MTSFCFTCFSLLSSLRLLFLSRLAAGVCVIQNNFEPGFVAEGDFIVAGIFPLHYNQEMPDLNSTYRPQPLKCNRWVYQTCKKTSCFCAKASCSIVVFHTSELCMSACLQLWSQSFSLGSDNEARCGRNQPQYTTFAQSHTWIQNIRFMCLSTHWPKGCRGSPEWVDWWQSSYLQ